MVRLILEEQGKRRAFRVGDGVLKLGSGEAATLRLASEGVADEHAELEIVGDHAKLRVAAGVAPPEIDGETVLGEVELRQGQGLRLGDALIWIEDEALEAGAGRPAGASPAAAAAPSPAARPSAGASRSRTGGAKRSSGSAPSAGREASRQRAMQAARERGDRGRVQRSRPRVERGLPTGAVLGIIGAVLIVGGFALRKAFQVSAENTVDNQATLITIGTRIEEGAYEGAENLISILNLEKLSDSQRTLLNGYRDRIAKGREEGLKDLEYAVGTRFFDSRLQRYEERHLQGSPEPHEIRLFLKRCKEFRDRWPGHPQMEWVSRQEQRFRGAVNLSAPPTFDDIDWEIGFSLRLTPRVYEPAIDMLEDYLKRTDTPELDREAAQTRLAEIFEERPEQFLEAKKWAKHEYEVKRDNQKAVHWLVFAAAYMGDDAMEDEAARLLLEMPDLKQHLEAYQRDRPDVFAALMENRVARSKASEFGLL